jgi:hypothetical protein
MNERIPAQRERPLGSGGGGTLFDEASDIPATVTVSSGPYREDLPAGNLSVGEIRRRFGDRFDLDPHSQAVVDGHAVADDVVVRPGQALMFTRQAGEKGGRIPANGSAGLRPDVPIYSANEPGRRPPLRRNVARRTPTIRS